MPSSGDLDFSFSGAASSSMTGTAAVKDSFRELTVDSAMSSTASTRFRRVSLELETVCRKLRQTTGRGHGLLFDLP